MAGWFTQGWEVKARALHSLKTLKPQHVSAETCPKELTPAPSRTFIQAGMMFSEIKHPHFKLHPQGHGGFAETLAGLFRGGWWKGATVGQEACSVSVACGPVWVCFHTV